MQINCQFRPPFSSICDKPAEVVSRGAGENGSDLYVCRRHDMFCYKCGRQATEQCERVVDFKCCGAPECSSHSHNGEHEE